MSTGPLGTRALDQAVPKHLDPLPFADVGDYVALRSSRPTGMPGRHWPRCSSSPGAILNEA